MKKRHFIIHSTFFTGTKFTKSECNHNLNLVVVVGDLGRYQRGIGFDSIFSQIFTLFMKENGKRGNARGEKSRSRAGMSRNHGTSEAGAGITERPRITLKIEACRLSVRSESNGIRNVRIYCKITVGRNLAFPISYLESQTSLTLTKFRAKISTSTILNKKVPI